MAAKFWIGGTGNWDNTNDANWSTSTGGANNTTHPVAGDAVTIDGASGAGTITMGAVTIACTSITCGAMGMTLDGSVNNPTVNLTGSFNGSGTGTRTIKLGNGTWTITSGAITPWNMGTTTGLTFAANSSTISLTPSANALNNFAGGGLTYNTLTLNAGTGSALNISGANTFATLNISPTLSVGFPGTTTTTITNAFNWAGTSSNQLGIQSATMGTTATVSCASGSPTMAWAFVHDVTFSGGATFTATNSFNGGHNSGITITAPSSGSGAPLSRAFTGM